MSKTPIPPAMKAAVLRRDGEACLKCRRPVVRHMDSLVRPDTIAFDHIRSEYRGGVTHPDNLQVLCTLCNQQKGTTTRDYRANKAPIPGFGRSPSSLSEPRVRRPRSPWPAIVAAYLVGMFAIAVVATQIPATDHAMSLLLGVWFFGYWPAVVTRRRLA